MAMSDIPEICREYFERILEVNSELSIEVVDHVIKLMNDKLRLTPKMFFCSHIYHRSVLSRKIGKWTDFVQIHLIDEPNCHYLISCQVNGQISIYDSVDNEQHVRYLLPQLQIVYEDVNENELQYKVPQTQGNEDLNLCGFFAVANAISLLNAEVPESRPLDKSSLRLHLHNCIIEEKLCLFPQCTDVFKNTDQGHDSLQVREGISSPSVQQIALISNMKLSLTSEADLYKYKLVDGKDLDNLMQCCSENWLHLALFVSMPDNLFQNNITAKYKVITHFTVVKEMIKEKRYPKFDVVLLDLLHRIYLLMKTGMNWEALKNNLLSLSKTGCISDEEIHTVSKVVNNFDIFWAIFKLPHLNVKERLRWFKLSEDNLDEIDLALCELNEEIEKLNVYEEKIAKFLSHEVLINIIRNSSTARQELLERIDKFSIINVNFKLVQKKYGSLGIPEGMENMMLHDSNADILDIDKEYVLKNDHMIGESVESGLGKGTLGWVIKDKSGIQCLSTSLHIMFNSDRMKMLAKDYKYNGYMDHKTLLHSSFCGSWFEILNPCKLDCYISSDRFLFEMCKAIYKQGCNAKARFDDKGTVEIALLRMKKGGPGKKKEEECLIKKNMLQQWIDLKLPRVLSFEGRFVQCNKGMEVLKIGNKTGITKATIAETDVDVSCPMPDGNYRIELQYQIAVQWIADNPFSTEGDSGAPVFFLGKSGEMFAVGMVSASQKQNRRSIITPIGAILNACEGSLAPFKIILEEKS